MSTSVSECLVNYRIESGIAHIHLNRPQKLNSLNTQMCEFLRKFLVDVRQNKEVRSVLLSAEGRAFCAGQDLADAPVPGDGKNPDLGAIVRENYIPVITAIRTIEKPFVCAVQGVAAGAGASLALACDIVVAGRDAGFVQAFSKIGLVPDAGGTFMLPRLVGLGRASALMLLGEKVNAENAFSIGMIARVVENDQLMHSARAIAQQLATMPTRGLGLTKLALNRSFSNDLSAQLELEAQLQSSAGCTHDFKEGVCSFLEKRAPNFRGE